MPSVCLYFKMHQPSPLQQAVLNGKQGNIKSNNESDTSGINRVADECYLPANELILRLIKEFKGEFKVCFAVSGTTISQLQQCRPDVIDSLKTLVNTECVELLGETYYHSLSYLHSSKEFVRQVQKHKMLLQEVFNITPKVFVNTALVYNNNLPLILKDLGFAAVLCEGVDSVLNGRNINKLYRCDGVESFRLLLRHASLSDDVAFRFNDKQWNEYPLGPEKFASWVHAHDAASDVINLYLDYETFGLHKNRESGIFHFLEALPVEILSNPSFEFSTASEALELYKAEEIYNVPQTISWHNKAPDNCIWSENIMQNNAIRKIYRLENLVLGSNDEHAMDAWGKFQCADYFYQMKNGPLNTDNNTSQNGSSPLQLCQTYLSTVASFEMALLQKVMDNKSTQENNSYVTLY